MVKIGIVQMKTCESKEVNINNAKKGIEECVKKGAEIVILPEIFNSPYDTAKFKEFSEKKNGPTWSFLSNMAKFHKIILIGGSIPEIEDEKVYNTSFIFDINGEQIGCHRKMHLFDIDIKNGQYFKESDSLSPGNSICVFNTKFCKIGVCICFDMRFPELSRLMVDKGAEIIVVPGAFNMTTGPAHWDLMFRQRAVDNQCYTIGVAPARNEKLSYISYANSIIVDPWGKVVYHANEEESFDVVEIDLNRVKQIREQLPLLSARRKDIYSLIENEKNINDNEIKIAKEGNAFEIYYILDKAREKLKKMGINQWAEGWDINEIKQKCKNGCFYVMYDKRDIIGCYCIEKNTNIDIVEEKEFTYISLICLFPNYQGKGIGKKLLQSAIQNSTKIVYIDCISGNNKLKSFFIENGFKCVKDIHKKEVLISLFKKE